MTAPRVLSWFLLAVVGCDGSSEGPAADASSMDASDEHPMDPADPVEPVPAHGGIYKIGMLSTDENIHGGSFGTWFTDATSEHEVLSADIVRFARYRDRIVMQELERPTFWVFDPATATASAAIDLPSDAVGIAAIRGGFVYVGGLAKIYSYEIATQQWRQRPLPGVGTCHHVTAGATRLFAVCSGSTEPNERHLFSMWANKTMSDVVPLGALSPSSPEFGLISASPAADIAYFRSSEPMEGCIGSATSTSVEPCEISVRSLLQLDTATVHDLRPSEDGALLFFEITRSIGDSVQLYTLDLATQSARYVTSDVKAFATCPDNAVFIQRGMTISRPERYAGGVHTDLRLVNGGQRYIECALQPQPQ